MTLSCNNYSHLLIAGEKQEGCKKICKKFKCCTLTLGLCREGRGILRRNNGNVGIYAFYNVSSLGHMFWLLIFPCNINYQSLLACAGKVSKIKVRLIWRTSRTVSFLEFTIRKNYCCNSSSPKWALDPASGKKKQFFYFYLICYIFFKPPKSQSYWENDFLNSFQNIFCFAVPLIWNQMYFSFTTFPKLPQNCNF